MNISNKLKNISTFAKQFQKSKAHIITHAIIFSLMFSISLMVSINYSSFVQQLPSQKKSTKRIKSVVLSFQITLILCLFLSVLLEYLCELKIRRMFVKTQTITSAILLIIYCIFIIILQTASLSKQQLIFFTSIELALLSFLEVLFLIKIAKTIFKLLDRKHQAMQSADYNTFATGNLVDSRQRMKPELDPQSKQQQKYQQLNEQLQHAQKTGNDHIHIHNNIQIYSHGHSIDINKAKLQQQLLPQVHLQAQGDRSRIKLFELKKIDHSENTTKHNKKQPQNIFIQQNKSNAQKQPKFAQQNNDAL